MSGLNYFRFLLRTLKKSTSTSHMRRISLVFTRMLALFLISVLPIYLSSVYINYRGQRDLEKKTIESAIPKVDFYAKRMSDGFSAEMGSLSKLYVNNDVKTLSLTTGQSENYAMMESILSIESRLTEIREQSEFVSELSIYIPMIHKRISASSINDIPPGEFEMFTQICRQGIVPFALVDRRLVWDYSSTTASGKDIYMCMMPYFSDISVQGQKVPEYIITMKVDQDAIQKMLADLSKDSQGAAILLSTGHGLDFTAGVDPQVLASLREALPNSQNKDGVSKVVNVNLMGKDYFVAYSSIASLDSTLVTLIPRDNFLSALTQYKDLLWIVSILTGVLVLLFTLLVHFIFIRPLDTLVEGFAKVEKGDLGIDLKYKNRDEFGYLYERFNTMCRRLATLIEQEYEQRLRAQKAELKQLQYQINPHFLYNSLFLLYRMAKMENYEGVLKLSEHMGGYYRFVTKSASDDATLEAELNHAIDYIQIQTMRYGGRIRVEMPPVREEYAHIVIPKLILQPIIENAYNHGLQNKVSGGVLRMQIDCSDHLLRILVEDNGEDMNAQTLEKMRASLLSSEYVAEDGGLVNIHRRLAIRYNNESGLNFSIGALGGLCVEIRLPLSGRE